MNKKVYILVNLGQFKYANPKQHVNFWEAKIPQENLKKTFRADNEPNVCLKKPQIKSRNKMVLQNHFLVQGKPFQKLLKLRT